MLKFLGVTGLADKELFPCSHPEREEERESTTFWDDFSIADRYGAAAVEDTYRRAFGGWKSSYKYLTELVMVLNHKIWQHHGAGDDALARLYDRLWREADAYGTEHLKGEEAAFFYAVLDQPGRPDPARLGRLDPQAVVFYFMEGGFLPVGPPPRAERARTSLKRPRSRPDGRALVGNRVKSGRATGPNLSDIGKYPFPGNILAVKTAKLQKTEPRTSCFLSFSVSSLYISSYTLSLFVS